MDLPALITNSTNVRYLSNFTGSSGFMLLTKNKKYLFTDSRYILRAQDTIKKDVELVDITRVWRNPQELEAHWQALLKKHRIEKLGVEEDDLRVSRYKKFKKLSKGVKFHNISGQLEEKREVKSTEEIKKIKKSQQINEKVFLEIEKIIKSAAKSNKKVTEIELAWKIKELGFHFGAEDVSFDPIVAFDKHSASPHHGPDQTKLKKDSLILIDMGMKYQGYCSDMTRVIFADKPTKAQAEIYNLVLKAQNHALENIKAGVTGAQADAYSREIINASGHQEHYTHAGGHGVGLDIHESPALASKYNKKIKANTVITVEPGIYLPGKFGVRIEDMALVKENGIENLSKIKKQLDVKSPY